MEPSLLSPNLLSRTPELPADVILTILEELHKVQSISHLRVVSKQFEALATPLAYRHVHLTERIVAPFASPPELYDPMIVQLQVARCVKLYARHLTVKRDLDWFLVAKLIKSLDNLRSLTWAFWGTKTTNFQQSANKMIGPALCKTWPEVIINVEGIRAPKHFRESTHQSWEYPDFPNSNLVSCKIDSWMGHKDLEIPIIRDLLFERPKLQELHLVRGRTVDFQSRLPRIATSDNQVRRLPPLKKLILNGYDWSHSAWESSNLWDWSRITHLELRGVQVANFLHHVPHSCLSGLRVFIEYSSNCDEQCLKRKDKLLCSLLNHTTALRELDIYCHTQQSEMVSLIASNGRHLRFLNLRSLRISSGWTPLTVDQVKTLGSSCPQLMEIQVDLQLPALQLAPSPSSHAVSRTARAAPASTVMTRSMTRAQNTKPDGGEAKEEIPRWYMAAYADEKYQEPRACVYRLSAIRNTAREEGKDASQVEEEYLAWKRDHRKAEVADALEKSRVHADPTSALAAFRNLRRLTVFTRFAHFVEPERSSATKLRLHEAVRTWLNRLLSNKAGAEFEKVVIVSESEVINEDIELKMIKFRAGHNYKGKRDSDGSAEFDDEWTTLDSVDKR